MRSGEQLVITKRDGSREVFSLPKLRGCLARVLRACGSQAHLADPLARALAAHLAGSTGERAPTSNYLYRCVRTAFVQTGLSEAADELAVQRRLRATRRRRLRVVNRDGCEQRAARWCRSALVATLREVYQLGQPVARFLSGRVEERVFDLGSQVISKKLVAGVLRDEVLAWGLSDERTHNEQNDRACPGSVASGPLEEET